MRDKDLISGEKIITQSDDKTVTLTNKRIRLNETIRGKAHIVSILLQNVSSIEIVYKSKFYLFQIGGILLTLGLVSSLNNGTDYDPIVILIGVIFIINFFFSRKHVISIASNGGAQIVIKTTGMSTETVTDFMNKIENEMGR